MKLLVAGWFSFEQMGATAGDLMSRDLVCEWLRAAGHDVDIAVAPPFSSGVDWRNTDPADYSVVIFICGPCGNGPPLDEFIKHFSTNRLFGMNLSMLEDLKTWNPFELLLERDSSAMSRPDLVFLSEGNKVPLVGLLLVHKQAEYGVRAKQDDANRAIERLLASREAAIIPIDTRLDENSSGLKSSGQIESVIARMDLVVTTRLHGLVLALKNGVPALAVDAITGGSKVTRQAKTIGWPVILSVDNVDDAELQKAFDFCLSEAAREEAAACAERARTMLSDVRGQLVKALDG